MTNDDSDDYSCAYHNKNFLKIDLHITCDQYIFSLILAINFGYLWIFVTPREPETAARCRYVNTATTTRGRGGGSKFYIMKAAIIGG